MVEQKIQRTAAGRKSWHLTDRPRCNGLLRVGLDVTRLLKGVIPAQTLMLVQLRSIWDDVIPDGLASMCSPVKLSGSTLHINPLNGAARLELPAYADRIIDNINFALGQGVVSKLKFV